MHVAVQHRRHLPHCNRHRQQHLRPITLTHRQLVHRRNYPQHLACNAPVASCGIITKRCALKCVINCINKHWSNGIDLFNCVTSASLPLLSVAVHVSVYSPTSVSVHLVDRITVHFLQCGITSHQRYPTPLGYSHHSRYRLHRCFERHRVSDPSSAKVLCYR